MLRAARIEGFTAPGLTEKIITTLFADDTSTFLSKGDKWRDLWGILRTWCKASKARFNGGKTEVIPVGTKEYRREVIRSRRINPYGDDDDLIEDTIRIAPDGEPTRILGAWIGNKVDQVAIWTPTIQKIRAFVERWMKCRPTMTGKRHIAQMGPAGISQYLTLVQGMPTSVETELQNIVREMIWGETRSPPVAMQQLYKPVEDG
ncbi:hypothetical protein FOMPIDRAFT_25517, partial [Fomitopsis schrenkii]